MVLFIGSNIQKAFFIVAESYLHYLYSMNTNNSYSTTAALELFGKSLMGSNYSPLTLDAYLKDISQFLDYMKEIRIDWDRVDRFTRTDIVEFLNHLANNKYTGVSRVRKLAAIRKFFTFLVDSGYLQGNPSFTVKGPRREEKDPSVLYKNEYKALLYEASQDIRDYAILQTFLQTGIRVGELANLTIEDIDLDNKLLCVRQGKGKKDRTIPLEDQSLKAVQKYLVLRAKSIDNSKKGISSHFLNESPVNSLFLAKNGTSMDVRTIRYLVEKYVKKAGITKRVSVHTLRHTFGTHKVDKGMSIPNLKELLGHRKMETTYKYVHLAKTTLRQQQIETAL